MTFDLETILAGKRRHRSRLAAWPIAEKLRMLDALRERTLTIRRSGRAARPVSDSQAAVSARESTPHRDTER